MTMDNALENREQAELQYFFLKNQLDYLLLSTKYHCTCEQRKRIRELEEDVKYYKNEIDHWDYTIAELQWIGQ